MLKKNLTVMLVGCSLFLGSAGAVIAADYQSMTLEELDALRGTSALADPAERKAFQHARQEKIRALSPEDRGAYQAGNRYVGETGTRTRLQDGSCTGSMQQIRQGGGHRGKR